MTYDEDVKELEQEAVAYRARLAMQADEIERLQAAAKLVVETWDAEDHPVPMQNLRRAIEGLRTVR